MSNLAETLRQSVTAKVVLIGTLVLTLLIPVGMILGIVEERARLHDEARRDIADVWGRAQTIGGPVLTIPTG